MHPDTREVAAHMKELGLTVLGRAIHDSTFSETMRPFAHGLAVVHAAHGAEIVLKARIAQEHPLLLPKEDGVAAAFRAEPPDKAMEAAVPNVPGAARMNHGLQAREKCGIVRPLSPRNAAKVATRRAETATASKTARLKSRYA